jgi:hypothetical protein
MSSDNGTPKSAREADKRIHQRTLLTSQLRITHASFGSIVVKTKDISEGGVYILTEKVSMPPEGTILEGQIHDGIEGRPIVRMEVVRLEANGIGLKFLD